MPGLIPFGQLETTGETKQKTIATDQMPLGSHWGTPACKPAFAESFSSVPGLGVARTCVWRRRRRRSWCGTGGTRPSSRPGEREGRRVEGGGLPGVSFCWRGENLSEIKQVKGSRLFR